MVTKEEHKQNIREFKKFLIDDLVRYRKEKGLTLEELSKETRIQLIQLKSMEIGHQKDWSHILKLAKFYEKKIRLEFY